VLCGLADRVVQASLKSVLEPIFEADFRPCSHGFGPNQRAQDAIAEIHHMGSQGYHWVLEADIAACFDELGHTPIMEGLRRRIKDKRICALVKAFLKAGVMTTGGDREETVTGTPQGGILSPLIANMALSVLDDHFEKQWSEMGGRPQRETRRRKGLGTWRLIRYADLCRVRHKPTISSCWSVAAGNTSKHCTRRSPMCSPRWGCGCRLPRHGSHTSTTGSSSSGSASSGAANAEPISGTSTPSSPTGPSGS